MRKEVQSFVWLSLTVPALAWHPALYAQYNATPEPTRAKQYNSDKDFANPDSNKGPKASVGVVDQDLFRRLAQANLVEIAAAKAAQAQSDDEQVQRFAKHMIDDHTKAWNELAEMAKVKSITLPTQPDDMQQQMVAKLRGARGKDVKQQYFAQFGLQAHQETLKLLNTAHAQTQDADLKTMIERWQPIVQEHLRMAADITNPK